MKKKTSLILLLFVITLWAVWQFAFAASENELAIKENTQKPLPFAYLKGTYRGIDYKVWRSNTNSFENYCGISELSKHEYKNPENEYFTLDKVKLFHGSIKIDCMKLNFDNKSTLCTSNHPIAKDAIITIQFNTVFNKVPKDQWDIILSDLTKHIESQMSPDEIPNLEQICQQLKNQHTQ
jgi:hypothetical protein